MLDRYQDMLDLPRPPSPSHAPMPVSYTHLDVYKRQMNESAQNALLKILEEPPDYGAFLILSTNAERLLPTIRSRCAELQLGPVDEQTALPFLRQQAPSKPEQLLRAAYLRADGFLGQALALLQLSLIHICAV